MSLDENELAPSQGAPEGATADTPDTPDLGTGETPETEGHEPDGAEAKEKEEAEKLSVSIEKHNRRVDRLKRQKWESERQRDEARQEAQAARAELEAYRQSLAQRPQGEGNPGEPRQDQPPQRQPSQRELEAAAEAKIGQRQARQRFDEDCNRAFQDGVRDYPDFREKIEVLKEAGFAQDRPLAILMETVGPENAHKVLYQLGSDPDEAERIASLSPIRQAAALAKLADAPARPTPSPSRAPPPIKPLASGTTKVRETDPEKMGMDDFAPWWEERQRKKRT